MNYTSKCYEVLNNDVETIEQWPEIKKGFRFQVLHYHTLESGAVGATKIICLKSGKVFDVNMPINDDGEESWFWCVVLLQTCEGFSKFGEVKLKELDGSLAANVNPMLDFITSKETKIIDANAFAEAIIDGKMNKWVRDSFYPDIGDDEIRSIGYSIREGIKLFSKM